MKFEYFWQLVLLVIGVIATTYAGYWMGNRPEQSNVVEYLWVYNEDATKIFGKGNEVSVLVKGSPVESIQSLTYYIANTSNKNLENLKIYFRVESEKEKLLFVDYRTSDGMPSIAMKQLSPSDDLYGFEFDYLNRSSNAWSGAKITFYFSGEEKPTISVMPGSKGMKVQEYKETRAFSIERVLWAMSKMWPILAAYFIFFAITSYLSSSSRKLKDEMFHNVVFDTVNDESISREDKAKRISVQYEYKPTLRETIRSLLR